ncbi:chaplin family protein [Streptomyces hirsutus]|uniref:chaplin family protein n=1 Tax=Streptomyces hirsutus TaxID=35620 RepID=UPI003868FBBB|nr:chaplin family protein [Streptomyces hirsutus]
MRQVTRKGLMTVAAASGVIAAAGGIAHADSGAQGVAKGSPGVLSGNSLQAPVHVPVNVCGNTVDAVGVLNPSVGNSCAHHGGSPSSGRGGAQADGHTTDSPGVASGNRIEAPVHVPVNVCGNSVDVIGLGNVALGNDCASGGAGEQEAPSLPGEPGEAEPGPPSTPGEATPGEATPGGSAPGHQPVTHTAARPQGDVELAATGSELPVGLALPVGAGALLAGVVLYRKARAAA